MTADDDRAQLAELQRDWMRGVQERDMDRLEEIVADGFRFTAIHLNPEPMSREQWMDAAMEGYTITTFAFVEMEIDLFGDTAVIHARYSQIANFAAVSLANLFRLTDVWTRIGGRWQVVARHASVYG